MTNARDRSLITSRGGGAGVGGFDRGVGGFDRGVGGFDRGVCFSTLVTLGG